MSDVGVELIEQLREPGDEVGVIAFLFGAELIGDDHELVTIGRNGGGVVEFGDGFEDALPGFG